MLGSIVAQLQPGLLPVWIRSVERRESGLYWTCFRSNIDPFGPACELLWKFVREGRAGGTGKGGIPGEESRRIRKGKLRRRDAAG